MKLYCAIFLSISLMSCGGGSTSTSTVPPSNASAFSYRTITAEDLLEVTTNWQERDLSARSVTIVFEEATDNYELQIVQHESDAGVRYGAIVRPANREIENLPIVILTDGLDQANPTINLDNFLSWHQGSSPLADFIQVIPTLRGRTMTYQGLNFVADGDFCDAYDGATDDYITMTNVAESLHPDEDFSQLLVWGGSRGGNSGLLLAARDSRVHTVLAAAAPVDFYRQEVRSRYGAQYNCQFFDNKTNNEARLRMLSSSPLYFPPLENIRHITLFHGANDPVVPLWNINEMTSYLQDFPISVGSYIYSGENHTSFYGSSEFIQDFNAEVATFLQRINNQQ